MTYRSGHVPPLPAGATYEVFMQCCCSDIEHCTLERYLSDVRILRAELDARRTAQRQGVAAT